MVGAGKDGEKEVRATPSIDDADLGVSEERETLDAMVDEGRLEIGVELRDVVRLRATVAAEGGMVTNAIVVDDRGLVGVWVDAIGDVGHLVDRMNEGVAVVADADEEDLRADVGETGPAGAGGGRGVEFLLAADIIRGAMAVSPDRVGRVERADAVGAEGGDCRKGADAGLRGTDIVDGLVAVHIGPGVGRDEEEAIAEVVAEGIDQTIGPAFNRSDRPKGGVDQDRVGGAEAHRFQLPSNRLLL